jgi:adiponectin receptor
MAARVIRAKQVDGASKRAGCCDGDTVSEGRVGHEESPLEHCASAGRFKVVQGGVSNVTWLLLHLAQVISSSPDLPSWLADPFIHRGYRMPGSWCAICKSMFTLHNETMNIYTHGIGAVFFLVVLILAASATNLGAATSMALPSLADPGRVDAAEFLHSAFWNLHHGVESLERAGMAALENIAGLSLSSVRQARLGHPEHPRNTCGGAWQFVRGGLHTGLVLQAALLEPGTAESAGQFAATCASDIAGVSTTKPDTGVMAAVNDLFRGARVRLHSAVVELERLGTAASGQAAHMGEAMELLREETAAHLASLGDQIRALGKPGSGSWDAEESLRAFASAAEAMEEDLELRLDEALLLTARQLGVERQHVRLTALSESHGPTGAVGVHGLADTHATHKWPVLVFLSSALTCLMCSVVFHLFWVVDEKTYKLLARLDYAGIAVLIAGSTCPIIMYGFECDKTAVIASSCLMYGSCAIAVGMGLMDKFNTEQWRPVRALVFVVAGCAGIFPIGYFWWTQGHHAVVAQASLQIVVMGALYIVGAALYVTRVPERFFPGKLDLFGASHQLFHTLVFAAAFLHYHTVLLMFRWRAIQPECSA